MEAMINLRSKLKSQEKNAGSDGVEEEKLTCRVVNETEKTPRRSQNVTCLGLCNGDVAFCVAAHLCEYGEYGEHGRYGEYGR